MSRRNRRRKALAQQQIVASSNQSQTDSMPALSNQMEQESGNSLQQEPLTEKPVAAIEAGNNPPTEKPVAAGNQAGLAPAPQLTLLYMPVIGQAVLARGAERMLLSPKEMMGLMAPDQAR